MKHTFLITYLGEPLFSFQSQAQWINKAKSWFVNCGVPSRDTICIDAFGRICTRGEHFPDDANVYPITVYRTRPGEGSPSLRRPRGAGKGKQP